MSPAAGTLVIGILIWDFGEIHKIMGMYNNGNVSNLILLGYTKGIKGIYC